MGSAEFRKRNKIDNGATEERENPSSKGREKKKGKQKI
jgi:hypothetical protein